MSDSRPKWAKCISVFRGAKTPPDGAALTYMAYIREYPPGTSSYEGSNNSGYAIKPKKTVERQADTETQWNKGESQPGERRGKRVI